jgi:hypothetical protein
MEYLLFCAIWGIVGYVIANEVKKREQELDISPILYGIGSFTFGILWCMIFLAIKYYGFKKRK